MIIKIKQGKDVFEKKISDFKDFEISPKLVDIFQDSNEIAFIKMENSAPSRSAYIDYGCRFVDIYRLILHKLELRYGIKQSQFTIVDMDTLADLGGEAYDCWLDGYYSNGQPFYNILNAEKLVEKINKKFGVNLLYERLDSVKFNHNTRSYLINYFLQNIAFGIKMPNLVMEGDHFVNVDKIIYNNNECYFRMKETYKNYNGYDGFWINWDYPKNYEIIL